MKNKYYPGLLAAIMLVLYSLPGVAQDTSKGRWSSSAKADKLSDKIDKELHLSKEQDKQIHAINQDISLRRDAIKHDTTISKKQKLAAINTLDTERSHRFKSVLTPAQYKKWNDWEMKKKEKLEAKMDKKQEKKLAKQQ
jgi:Spy/CpxP family protein refolding chaperone